MPRDEEKRKKREKEFLKEQKRIREKKEGLVEKIKQNKKKQRIRRKKLQLGQMQVKQNQRLIKRIEALQKKSAHLNEMLKGISTMIGLPQDKYDDLINSASNKLDKKDLAEIQRLRNEYEDIMKEFQPGMADQKKKVAKTQGKNKGKSSKLSRKNLAARKGWIPM